MHRAGRRRNAKVGTSVRQLPVAGVLPQGVRGGAQYFVTRKVDGKPVDVYPRDDAGHILKNTARLWTLAQAREWARAIVVDMTRGVDHTPQRRNSSTIPCMAFMGVRIS